MSEQRTSDGAPVPSHGSLDTRAHLAAHHGDPVVFRDRMRESAAGRFGPLWWGLWEQHVAPELPDAPALVDLGCGPGGLFAPLRARHPDARITALEVQPLMVEAAREEGARQDVEVLRADLNAPLPLDDASAHAVMAVMLIHELPHPVPLLAEIERILAPGGTLVIFDWASQPLRTYAAGQELDRELIAHFREHCLWAADDLSFMCERQGLVPVEVIVRDGGKLTMIALRKPAP